MKPQKRRSPNNAFLLMLAVHAAGLCTTARAGPINTDVAMTPRKGGSILRLQYIYGEAKGRGEVEEIRTSRVKATYVFGLKSNLALFLTETYVNRKVERITPEREHFEDTEDGFADVTFLVKYRFWQDDRRPGESLRWAVLGGLNIRSGDSKFTSDSYDPILGTVFTWPRDRGTLSTDLVYQFNTGGGESRHDALRYDLAYSYRLTPATYEPGHAWEINAVGELNGRYVTDGAHEIFLSPGLQFVTQQWIFETSIQLPVLQDLDGPETDYRIVVGLRFQW